MDLSLTETQEEFKKVAQDFVKAEVPAHLMTQWYKNKHTFQPQLVKKAAEIGWLGMMLPEEYGGSGVVPGWTVPAEQWAERISMLTDSGCILQRRIRPEPEPFPQGTGRDVVDVYLGQSCVLGTGSGGNSADQNTRRLFAERCEAICFRCTGSDELSLRCPFGRR